MKSWVVKRTIVQKFECDAETKEDALCYVAENFVEPNEIEIIKVSVKRQSGCGFGLVEKQ